MKLIAPCQILANIESQACLVSDQSEPRGWHHLALNTAEKMRVSAAPDIRRR